MPEKRTTPRKQAAKKTTGTAERAAAQGVPLDVPSGKTALVRPVGMDVFMQRGMIPNSLMPLVTKAMSENKPMTMADIGEVDESKMRDVLDLIDDVACFVVRQPKVHRAPRYNEENAPTPEEVGQVIPFEEREDQTLLYVDEVDMDDKMFIFQFSVGGTRDLERFREQQAAIVPSLPTGDDVAVPS